MVLILQGSNIKNILYYNFCFTIATSSEEYLSSNAKTSGSLVRLMVDALPVFISVFSLVIRLSAGSEGMLSNVVKLLELVVVVVVSVAVTVFS